MKKQRCEEGQGLVEFALILPILLLTTLLFLYLAQLFHTWSGLQAGAVAGARHASDTGSLSGVEDVVRKTLAAHTVDPADVDIEATALNSFEREIPTEFLGEQVMAALRKMDQVAYVRFASVYREFKDVTEFVSVLNELNQVIRGSGGKGEQDQSS